MSWVTWWSCWGGERWRGGVEFGEYGHGGWTSDYVIFIIVSLLPHCRQDISLVSNAPIGTGSGPQNITVITSQESHHQHVFLIRFAETHFPYSLETTT